MKHLLAAFALLSILANDAHSQTQGYQQMNQALTTLTNQWGTPLPTIPMQRMPTRTNTDQEQAERRYNETLREYQSGYSNPTFSQGFCKTTPRFDAYGNVVVYIRRCY